MAPTNAGILTLGNANAAGNTPQAPLPMGAAQPAPEIQGSAPEADSFSADGGVDQLGDLNLRPPVGSMRTGVSASPAEQLTAARIGSQASKLMASAPDPNAPMAWAKAWLGAGTGVIGSLGDAANIKAAPGGGWLDGVTQALANRNARLAQQKEQAAQQQHQKFEEQRETNKDKMEEDAFAAQRSLMQVQIEKAKRSLDKDAQDALMAHTAPWKKAAEDSGQTLLADGLTSADLSKLALEHKTPQDPQGVGWLHNQNVQQTGWKDEVNEKGDPIFRYGPNGEPLGSDRRQTFGVYTWGDDRKATPEMVSQLHDLGYDTYKVGDIIPAKAAKQYQLEAEQEKTGELAALKMSAAIQGTKKQIEDFSKSDKMQEAGKLMTPWLIDSKWDTGTALQKMQEAIAETDPKTGQPTPHAQAVKQQYDQIMGAMGPELIKDTIAATEKNQLETIKANAAKAKSDPLDVEGNPNLTGQAYIDSLPAASKPLVAQMAKGPIDVGSLGRILSNKDGRRLMQEVTLADPNFDSGKIDGYIKNSKEYAGGKIAQQLNSANTSLVHLKALFDDNLLPGSNTGGKPYAKRQSDLNDASLELARFLTGGNAPSNEDIASARKSLDPSLLRMGLNSPSSYLNSAVKEQADRIREKVTQYQEQWDENMPSPNWKRPMPGWHPDAATALEYIRNDGKPSIAAAAEKKAAAKQPTETFTPGKNVFNSQKWAAAHPGKDVEAAKKAAADQGFQVK